MTTKLSSDRYSEPVSSLVGYLVRTAIVASGAFIVAVYGKGLAFGERLAEVWGIVPAVARELRIVFLAAEGEMPEEGEKEGLTILGLSGIWLVLIIIGVILVCILPICVIVILALLGPVIGDVFSEINAGI